MRHSPDFRVPDPAPWSDVGRARAAANPPRPEGAEPCGNCLAICCWYLILEDDNAEHLEDLETTNFG